MHPDIKSLLDFIDEQKRRQASLFPGVPGNVTFIATTGRLGNHASVSVNPILKLEPTEIEGQFKVQLAGSLPRRPERGECIAVHITRPERFRGYQLKTRAVPPDGIVQRLYAEKDRRLEIRGIHVYTVHHSPYVLKVLEKIPLEEIDKDIHDVKYALVAVGEQANFSPRFVFHAEIANDRLVLFHGDGMALKTYMNLKLNQHETRLLLDLDTYAGYALEGVLEEFSPAQHPEAYDHIRQGFASGKWGEPARVFRLSVERWRPIAPEARGGP